jgi:hypothetical protein
MKTSKTQKVNRSKPKDLTSLTLDPDDCFGKEWEISAPECVRCSQYEECMVLVNDLTKEEEKSVRRGKHFLDEMQWESVPWDDLEELIKAQKTSLQDLRDVVGELAKCTDQYTIYLKVQNWLVEKNIKVEDGWLY